MTGVETWREIPGTVGKYEASSFGRIRSHHTSKARVLRAKADRYGYGRITLCTDSGKLRRNLHQWIAITFLGPYPPGAVVRHLDGDSLNNRVDNLAYGTVAENAQDSLRHGTNHEASKTHCPRQHAYDEANTGVYTTPEGRVMRRCRACRRQHQARYDRQRREAQHGLRHLPDRIRSHRYVQVCEVAR